jgi:hypothetical protein
MRWESNVGPGAMVAPAGDHKHEEGPMAAKKVRAKAKSATTKAKKGTRKVASTTPRGMARRQFYSPPSTE